MTRTVAVTGASGFVGQRLVAELAARGAHVIALGRSPQPGGSPPNVEWRRFDPTGAPDPAAFAGAGAVVHLAGESVAGRWNAEKKHRIAASRIDGTRTVVESLRALSRRPAVLVSASAIGYYGDRGEEPLTEESSPGTDFLATVCVAWEAAAREVESFGVRWACIRTGVALGDGGALREMLTPFKFGAGGPLGSGRQFVPWIDVRDLVALYCFAIENDGLNGPVNGVAPDYASNARLMQAIGAALRRPALAPAPAFALRAILGEFAQSLLQSQVVMPARARDARFQWRHAQRGRARGEILRGTPDRPYVHTFRATQFLRKPLDEVFRFFSDAGNLEAITPPALSFAIRSAPDEVQRGVTIAYELRLRGFPIRWKTLIAQWDPPTRFVDVQLHGPYRLWNHVHEFVVRDGGVEVTDRVDYVLPFAPIGEIASPMVGRDVDAIFRARAGACDLDEQLGSMELHLGLIVLGSRDLERSLHFYHDILQLRMKARFGPFILFETGAATLVISAELAPASGEVTHECVFNVGSVTQAYELFKERIAFLNVPRAVNDANWAVNFVDPDGHQWSFYGPE
jgi:hypothetical protein